MENKVTLYIATHNITGKKYFGKTVKWFTQEELQKNYHGSGKYWNKHKKKHGNKEVTMEIYQICSLNESDDDYVVPIALKFSEENDIILSEKWANLEFENGLHGGATKDMMSKETTQKMSSAKLNKVVVRDTLTNMIFLVSVGEFNLNNNLIAESKGKQRSKNKQCHHCLKFVYPSEEMYHFDYCYEKSNRLSRADNCQFCNNECTTHRLKRQHEITCTQNENKELYFCQYCDKQIGTRGQLTNHETQCDLNVNSIVRIYFCQYCNKEFKKSKLNLAKHEKYYCDLNPNAKKPEFKCTCGKIYTDKGNFTQHQKKCELRVNS